MRYQAPITVLLLFAALLSFCKKDPQPPLENQDADEQYTGGKNGTSFTFGENAFGISIKGMSAEQDGFFVTGNSLFRTNWVTAPSSVQSLDGLGPLLNDISCGSCHFKDGRAKPPELPDEPLRGLLFRLSIPGVDANGGPLPEPNYGGQLQDKAILDVQPEANVRVVYENVNGTFDDGTTYTLRKPVYQFLNNGYGEFVPGMLFSPRIAQQLPGLGLLEIVDETTILALADESDVDGDGVSGKANYVWDVEKQQLSLGRFGWKANQPTLKQQAAGAFNGDIGITSALFPQDHLTPSQQAQYQHIPNGGAPEIADDLLKKVEVYLQGLAVPARRNHLERDVLRGKLIFNDIKCATCHHPQFVTGQSGQIDVLKGQKIWPYSDLLLHDMGNELADGRPDFLANGREWRTPPLWGIGLVPEVNGHSFYLHDGRARNIEEAILWHGGEAEQATKSFKKLEKADRDALIRFVESL
ncbi:MAG: thiol oxidoreductase [Saprospiraceae bacterium]|nr:thiol oxidoreductase [Saprospiraceae bacterium]